MPKKRWMVFVDGENLTIRAQKLDKGNYLTEGRYYLPDVFVWTALTFSPISFIGQGKYRSELEIVLLSLEIRPIRAYYYTSLTGDDNALQATEEALWNIGFQPRVFKRTKKGAKSKGVDIALATDFLSNAFLDNYDAAFLFSGDGDYIPLVNEVKRLGKPVFVSFFSGPDSGLNPKLRLASDGFIDIGYEFFRRWHEYGLE